MAGRTFPAYRKGTGPGPHQTAPIAGWLRAPARALHAELGGPGAGAIGMCLTGGIALAMMADAPVVAPVLAQPASPMAIGKRRAADLNLSPADLSAVRRKAAAGCPVLGLKYEEAGSWSTARKRR